MQNTSLSATVTLRRVPSLEDGESARSASENRPLVSLRVQRRPSEVVRTRRRDNGGEVYYTHLRAHETVLEIVCRQLREKKHNE